MFFASKDLAYITISSIYDASKTKTKVKVQQETGK